MLLDSLFNRAVGLPNVGNPIGTWDRVDSFHVLGVNRVFDESKRISNGIKGLESRGNIILLQNKGNPISGPLDKRELHLRDWTITRRLNPLFFMSSLESLDVLRSAIAIIFKNFKKMGFYFF